MTRTTINPNPLEKLKAPSHPRLTIACPEGNLVDVAGLASGKGTIKIGTVTLVSTGNVVRFGAGATLQGSIVIQGNNNTVEIGKNCVIRGDILVKGNGQRVTIGDETTFVGVYLLCQEGCNIDIGRWCMFSRQIEVRTTDAHSVIDAATGRRLNTPASVVIGSHVWVSVGAFISKGSVIGDDSIIGANSFVNGKFAETGVVIAGQPAKVVKRGVTWNRGRKSKFSSAEMNHWHSEPLSGAAPEAPNTP